MSNVTKAVELIFGMNRDELNQVAEAINMKRTQLAREAVSSMRVGDVVQFAGRNNRVERGTVTKVNRKTLVVKTPTTQWRVTASLCKKVETA